jgi:hypothetical protein
VIKDVEYGAASQVLALLNNEGPITLKDILALDGGLEDGRLLDLMPPLPPVNSRTLAHQSADQLWKAAGLQQRPLNSEVPSLPGYTTHDDAGSSGDDTIHAPIQFYDVPNCVGANLHFDPADEEKPEKVDLVYNEFVQEWILLALRYLGVERGVGDTRVFGEEGGKGVGTMTEVIAGWVGRSWGCEGNDVR